MKMRRVLVTGANGLLGANVVRELNAQGYLVRIIVREGANMKGLEGMDFELVQGEITRLADLQRAISGCDYVVHVAAKTSQAPIKLSYYLKPNVFTTEMIMNVCQIEGIKRLVYVSSANCFHSGPKDAPGNEEHRMPYWMERSGYAYSKFMAQDKVLAASGEARLETVVVNPTFIIGKYDAAPSSGTIFKQVLKRRVVFVPPGGKSFVGAENAAESVVSALTKGRNKEAYILSGENLSYDEFFRKAAKIAGRNPTFIKIPKGILKTASWLGNKCISFNKTNIRMLVMDNYFGHSKATRELGHRETDIDDCIEKSISWMRENRVM